MGQETLAKLTTTIQQSPTLSEVQKAELLRLLQTLQSEMTALAATHDAQAASITRFTDMSTQEVVRQPRDPQLLDLALQSLTSSVSDLETSHPQLVQLVNSLCVLLSNIGV